MTGAADGRGEAVFEEVIDEIYEKYPAYKLVAILKTRKELPLRFRIDRDTFYFVCFDKCL